MIPIMLMILVIILTALIASLMIAQPIREWMLPLSLNQPLTLVEMLGLVWIALLLVIVLIPEETVIRSLRKRTRGESGSGKTTSGTRRSGTKTNADERGISSGPARSNRGDD